MRGAIGLRDIFMKGHWSVAGASWPCEELDWDAMETDLRSQLYTQFKFV